VKSVPSKLSIKNVLARFIQEIWNEGNVDAADRYIAQSYTVHHDPGDPWHQRQLTVAEFKERVCLSRAPFPDQRFELQQTFSDGNAVVATWLWVGTHRGDLPGFPASGKQIKMSGATVYYFANDRIDGHWQIVDRLGVLQQLRSTT
jgi:steroid delta-isomerase-like uncharacterized protein